MPSGMEWVEKCITSQGLFDFGQLIEVCVMIGDHCITKRPVNFFPQRFFCLIFYSRTSYSVLIFSWPHWEGHGVLLKADLFFFLI